MFGNPYIDSASSASQMLQELSRSQLEYLERVSPTPHWYPLQDPKIHQAWQAALESAKVPQKTRFEANLEEWDQWLEEQHSHGVLFSRGDAVHYNASRTHQDAPGSTIDPQAIPG